MVQETTRETRAKVYLGELGVKGYGDDNRTETTRYNVEINKNRSRTGVHNRGEFPQGE